MRIRLPWAILGMTTIVCAQQTTVVSVKAAFIGQRPVTRSAVIMRAMCDEAGNVYSRPFDPKEPLSQLQAPIQEITRDAKMGSRFPANGAFFVRDQHVYSLAGPRDGLSVVEFAQEGLLKGRTKLEQPFFVQVSHVAVFKSGEYLVVGVTGRINVTGPHLRTPFTGVFATDGHLVKRIFEPEDKDAYQKAEGSDSQYFRCGSDSGNEFVGWNADLAAGSDGNVYLLHGVSPPLIYVISPTGDVLRKLGVHVGDSELIANSIKFFDNSLAIGFSWLDDAPPSLIKIIDLKGKPIADYIVRESTDDADPILACYNSDGFTLIPRWAGSTPYLLTVKRP